MVFETTVHGIPCKCNVTNYAPFVSAKLTGPMEDAVEAEGEEFDFELLDKRGNRAEWLDKYLTAQVTDTLLEDYLTMIEGELYT